MGIVDDKLKELSIIDKIRLTYGKGYWMTLDLKGIKSKIITDGPNGVRLQNHDLYKMYIEDSYESISYPSLSSLANSFDQKLLKKVGRQIGLEANSLDVSLILGPGVNIKRHPRGGRNFEYFSEDPIVSGLLAKSFIEGIQSSGVGACLKHFCCNNQELNRFLTNSIVDERTLHELYLLPYKIAIKSNPCAIMTSYNMTNGIYNSDNKYLLKDLLRDEYKFKGFYISDWGATNDYIESLKAGLNLVMPAKDRCRNSYIYSEYLNGNISEKEIDEAVKPLLKFLLKEKKKTVFDIEKVIKVALDAAIGSNVLLKNEDNILPLNKNDKILVVGEFFKKPRFQGSGSSKINPKVLITPFDSFNNHKVKYDYIEGFDVNKNITNLSNVLACANKYDKVLIFTGLPVELESEGYDRDSLNLPKSYIKAIKEISKVNNNIVVMVQAGSQTIIDYDNDIKGLIYSYLSGSLCGEAIYKLLFNKANFKAKLAETFVAKESDTYLANSFPIKDINNVYKEGLYVGYPYYYLKDIKPKYEFGYGLSYSKFKYDNIKRDKDKITIEITNESVKGYDTLFLFVEDNNKYIRLKDFKQIKLDKGQRKTISFILNKDMFKFYSVKEKRMVVGTNQYNILIGTSISNIIYKDIYNVSGEETYKSPSIDIDNLDNYVVNKNKFSLTSTLKDLEGTKYFNYVNEKVNNGTKLEDIPDLMTRHEKSIQYTSTPLRFYTIYVDIDLNIFELLGIINGLNGDKNKEKFYLNQKNNIFVEDKKINS